MKRKLRGHAGVQSGWLAVAVVVLVVVVMIVVAPVGGVVGRVPTQPTPSGPVYAGIPGAMPRDFVYRYNGSSNGWPVRPRTVQHPIRGAFIDPRGADDNGLSGYHFGIDINVDDAHLDPGAPTGLSHRVYALDAGVAAEPVNVKARRCINQRVEIGHFSYWHVSPTVVAGSRVRAGEPIGWTCRGAWHVHLSEWQLYRGKREWVNPLHRRGPLIPYADTAAPVVSRLVFVTPPSRPWQPTKSLAVPDTSTRLAPASLHGLVEIRARVADPQSYEGFLGRNPAWPTVWTPYELKVEIRNQTGRLVLRRITFRADQMPQTPYLVHYAPGTVEDDNMQECVGPPQLPRCDGVTWLRPLSRFHLEYWNTHAIANGHYQVTVTAYDIKGNTGGRTVAVTVRN